MQSDRNPGGQCVVTLASIGAFGRRPKAGLRYSACKLRSVLAFCALLIPLLASSLGYAASITYTVPSASTTDYVVTTVPVNSVVSGQFQLSKQGGGFLSADLNSQAGFSPFGSADAIAFQQLNAPQNSNPNQTFTTCDSSRCNSLGVPSPLKLEIENFGQVGGGAPPSQVTLTYNIGKYAQIVMTPVSFNGGGISVFAAARPATGSPAPSVSLGQAAQAMGYDHFNWVQTITSSTQLSVCQALQVLPAACTGFRTVNGTVPAPPTLDPPFGGWQYQGATIANPARDSLPGYWDEVFTGSGSSSCGPEVGYYYQQPGASALLTCQDPYDTKTVVNFQDKPTVPGVTTFETSLAGVGCSLDYSLVSTPCSQTRFDLIPGTQFQYTEAGLGGSALLFSGNVYNSAANALNQAGTNATNFVQQLGLQGQNLLNQYAGGLLHFQGGDFTGPTSSLTGYQLSNFFIPLSQFLTDSGLTANVLAADGIGIAPDSTSGALDPTDQARLDAFLTDNGGATPPDVGGTSVPEPPSFVLLATALVAVAAGLARWNIGVRTP